MQGTTPSPYIVGTLVHKSPTNVGYDSTQQDTPSPVAYVLGTLLQKSPTHTGYDAMRYATSSPPVYALGTDIGHLMQKSPTKIVNHGMQRGIAHASPRSYASESLFQKSPTNIRQCGSVFQQSPTNIGHHVSPQMSRPASALLSGMSHGVSAMRLDNSHGLRRANTLAS